MTARSRGSTSWLVDKSAPARHGHSARGDVWTERINRGLVRITTVTLLEIGYSARGAIGELTVLHLDKEFDSFQSGVT